MEPKFSILVVCLNAGEKLKRTLESIITQTFTSYEVIIKDGLSTDGSEEYVSWLQRNLSFIKWISSKDKGIYDAMNQAAKAACGKYLYYLNCGDVFHDSQVLERMWALIEANPTEHGIYYGNVKECLTGQVVVSNPKLDAFGCYRNVPCHQACFYDRSLIAAHPFELSYTVRADYEQFLWCFFTDTFSNKTAFVYQDILIADYEGGGFSETRKNRRRSDKEHKEIARKYMTKGQIWKYRLILFITLASLRTWIAKSPATAGFYNRIKRVWYERSMAEK